MVRKLGLPLLLMAIVAVMLWATIRGVLEDPTLVGSFATAAAALVGVALGRVWEKRLDLLQSHRERMAPTYEEIYKVVAQRSELGEQSDDERQAFWKKVQREMTLYAPDSVIREWLDTMASPAPQFTPDLLTWERFLFAVRGDLGHDNKRLLPGDLLRIYVGADEDGDVEPPTRT